MAPEVCSAEFFIRERIECDARRVCARIPFDEEGRTGIVDRETYIVLDEARNAVIVGGKQWDGLPRQQTEVVMTDGHRILGSAPAGELRDLRILIFSQNEVHFINPSANNGGIYRRFEK